MALVEYSGSESDSEVSEPKSKIPKVVEESSRKRVLLPQAIVQLGLSKPLIKGEEYNDHTKHGGRIRSFKHERGNWATYVYIPVNMDLFEDIQQICQTVLEGSVQLELPSDVHISLSKTVVLQHHFIDMFVETLKQKFELFTIFSAIFRKLKIYTNEENTRTFVALQADAVYYEKFLDLMTQIDDVMSEFKLPVFYKDPSFHISFLWCLGDKTEVLHSNLHKLESTITTLMDMTDFNIKVSEICCKSGNKDFTYALKS